MSANVGTADRSIRVVVGLALLSLTFLWASPMRWLGLIGLVPLLTALMSYCPLYSLLGISSRAPRNG